MLWRQTPIGFWIIAENKLKVYVTKKYMVNVHFLYDNLSNLTNKKRRILKLKS